MPEDDLLPTNMKIIFKIITLAAIFSVGIFFASAKGAKPAAVMGECDV